MNDVNGCPGRPHSCWIDKHEWNAVKNQVRQVHEAVMGNGHPENSVVARLTILEKHMKVIQMIGLSLVLAALGTCVNSHISVPTLKGVYHEEVRDVDGSGGSADPDERFVQHNVPKDAG